MLEKHEETRGLVAGARNDNRRTRGLLAELERTPKDGEAFLAKAAELREAFQQHVRDDKKELLPAVVKALGAEEASAAIAAIEDEKAGLEAARRADAPRGAAKEAEATPPARARRAPDEAAVGAAPRAEGAAKSTAGSGAATPRASVQAARDEAGAAEKAADQKADEKTLIAVEPRTDVHESPVEARAAAASEDAAKLGGEAARPGAAVARVASAAGADRKPRVEAPSEEGRQAAGEAVESAVVIGQSVVAVLGEQTRHAIETAAALGRARTLAEAAEAQTDFIGASLKRAARLNDRCLALARSGMGALSVASPR